MARRGRRKCKCCLKLFPARVTAVTSATARLPVADGPARLRANPLARPVRESRLLPRNRASRPLPGLAGGRVIPAIGVRRRAAKLRLKTSYQRKLLILLEKQAFSRAHRNEISAVRRRHGREGQELHKELVSRIAFEAAANEIQDHYRAGRRNGRAGPARRHADLRERCPRRETPA